jgi:hypothetical protein
VPLRSIGVIIVVFAWVVGCTVATGYIGERKGYSFGLFVALGFVLGVLGLIVAAVVPRKKQSVSAAV